LPCHQGGIEVLPTERLSAASETTEALSPFDMLPDELVLYLYDMLDLTGLIAFDKRIT